MVAAAGWWVLAVQLTPAADRPYIGGSQNNSLWNLIFGYNGFGRLTGNETGSVGGGAGGSRWGVTGLTRLFGVGHGVADLLAAAGRARSCSVAGLVCEPPARPHGPDPGRPAAVGRLAGGDRAWSSASGQGIIHPYYTVALAPAIGAVVGVGGLAGLAAAPGHLGGRTVLAATVAVDGGLGLDLDAAQPHLDAGAAGRDPDRGPGRRGRVGRLAVARAMGTRGRW